MRFFILGLFVVIVINVHAQTQLTAGYGLSYRIADDHYFNGSDDKIRDQVYQSFYFASEFPLFDDKKVYATLGVSFQRYTLKRTTLRYPYYIGGGTGSGGIPERKTSKRTSEDLLALPLKVRCKANLFDFYVELGTVFKLRTTQIEVINYKGEGRERNAKTYPRHRLSLNRFKALISIGAEYSLKNNESLALGLRFSVLPLGDHFDREGLRPIGGHITLTKTLNPS